MEQAEHQSALDCPQQQVSGVDARPVGQIRRCHPPRRSNGEMEFAVLSGQCRLHAHSFPNSLRQVGELMIRIKIPPPKKSNSPSGSQPDPRRVPWQVAFLKLSLELTAMFHPGTGQAMIEVGTGFSPRSPLRTRRADLIRLAHPCGARRVRSCPSPLRSDSRIRLSSQWFAP